MNDPSIEIKYNLDNSSTNHKVMAFLGGVISIISLLIFIGKWIFVPVGIMMILLLVRIFNKHDEFYNVKYIGGTLYLEKIDVTSDAEYHEILRHHFFGNYIHPSGGGNDSGYAFPSGPPENDIQLNLEIELKGGVKILFYEILFPWQDTPSIFEYKIYEKITYDKVFLLCGSMTKLKNKFSIYSNG